MSLNRNIYLEPEVRAVLRTADVYQIENEVGTVGYSEKLLSIVASFSNSGKPDGYNARCMVGKSKRGEVAMGLYARVDPASERFEKVGFQSRGCLAMTACASVIAQMLEGKSFEEALAISGDDIKNAVDGVPWNNVHTVYFALEGVKALIGDYLIRSGASLTELDKQLYCDQKSVGCIMTEHCSMRDARVELRLGLL